MFTRKSALVWPLIILLVLAGLSCSDDDKDITNSKGSATVTGDITIPAAAPGKDMAVIIDNDFDGGNGFVRIAEHVCGDATQFTYEFSAVARGTYYIYAVVFVVGDSEGEPVSGDYIGIYGGTISNPPTSANAVVPSSGTVNFDFDLGVMP